MKMMTTGRTSLYSGICILASVLTNRLVFTPLDSIAMAQSRSDILGVITGATLLLYGVGKADIAARQKEAVQLRGVDVRKGFSNDENRSVGYELEWAAEALLSAVPNIKSCAIFVNGTGWAFLGRFRDQDVTAELSPGGVLDLALKKGERAYLADMKTVPVKDVQFGFLPSNCQVHASYDSRSLAISAAFCDAILLTLAATCDAISATGSGCAANLRISRHNFGS